MYGTVSYGGACSSSTSSANSGNNKITLNTLSNGTYSNCTITLKHTDSALVNTLAMTAFTVDTSYTGSDADTTAPNVSVTTATITNSGNALVQSTETGTAYLVNTTVTVINLASITGAADNQWNSVAISSASTNTNLSATGLGDGIYKVYAVDDAGNLSSASSNSVTIDTTAPAAFVSSGTITNTGSATVQITEAGTAYLVNTNVSVSDLASITGAEIGRAHV